MMAFLICVSRSTGKERDAESGNVYFGARYYGSSMGRWMSPDYNEAGDVPDPVPYADLENPQSLNLYGYANNNPLKNTDPDGHKCDQGSVGPDGTFTFHCQNDPPAPAQNDAPGLWQQFLNWRQNMANNWNQRIAAHQPPPQQTPNNEQALQDLNNVMMGMVLLGGGPLSPNVQKTLENIDQTGKNLPNVA